MMKICHVTSVHKSSDVRIFNKECVSLAKAGNEVFLVARGNSRFEDGVRIIGCGEPPVNRLSRIFLFTKKIYKTAVTLDADIYHLHDPELLLYGLRLKRKGKKVIFDSHEDVAAQIRDKKYIPKLFRGLISKIYDKYQKYILKKLDAIISVTPEICEKLRKYNENTVLITNYPLIISKDLNTCNKIERTIIFTGSVTEQWSHENIIRAINDIENIKYIIYGPINKNYYDKLSAIPGWEKVEYRGTITHSEVDNVLKSASIGIALCRYSANTGWKEGSLGNTKIFEYMKAGIPVICSDFNKWIEIIEKNKCGICISPYDIEGIKNAIIYILNHPEEAEQMGENGRKLIIEKCNWKYEEEKLLKLYLSLEGKPL